MSVRIGIVGDVFIERDDPDEPLRRVAPLFAELDVVLANSEGVYARHSPRPPSAAHQLVSDPRCAAGLGSAGIHAVSVANNHTLDGGHEGLAETLAVLDGLGIATAGAGPDLESARRPAIVPHREGTLALLAYSSVFPVGYDARDGVPGVAPVRVDTFYSLPDPHFWTPEVPPRIRSMPWPSDIDALSEDVADARASASHVFVSFHWGDSFVPLQVQEYLKSISRAAVDAGADFVFGHHHHSLRGVGVHENTPIFYGLGNFAFDLWDIESRWPPETLASFRRKFGEYAFGPREGYPSFPFHPDYRMTMIVVVEIEDGRIQRLGVLPCIIRPDGPEPLGTDHPERETVFNYLTSACEAAGSGVTLHRSGGGNVRGFELFQVIIPDS